MPMSFPDFESLKRAAKVHKYREPREDETEAKFRSDLADHVSTIDFIESQEIRSGKGWDQWESSDAMDMLFRSMLKSRL